MIPSFWKPATYNLLVFVYVSSLRRARVKLCKIVKMTIFRGFSNFWPLKLYNHQNIQIQQMFIYLIHTTFAKNVFRCLFSFELEGRCEITVFDDFRCFPTFYDLWVSDFRLSLGHQNKKCRGKLYEQLLLKKFFLKVNSFRDFELRSVIFDDFGGAKISESFASLKLQVRTEKWHWAETFTRSSTIYWVCFMQKKFSAYCFVSSSKK